MIVGIWCQVFVIINILTVCYSRNYESRVGVSEIALQQNLRHELLNNFDPTSQPSKQPTLQPSANPSDQPSSRPTLQPKDGPSSSPSRQPSAQPFLNPSSQPSNQPLSLPSTQPTLNPSSPTSAPSNQPSIQPSVQPSRNPTSPTSQPSSDPSHQPMGNPSVQPSSQPSRIPTCQPVGKPSNFPTVQPYTNPSAKPSWQPGSFPSSQPSHIPSCHPSGQPSYAPTSPTCQPSGSPSHQPNSFPSFLPSLQPSSQPSSQPITYPSSKPTEQPFMHPSSQPSFQPSRLPSCQPISWPSRQPSIQPLSIPSGQPSSQPSLQPSRQPTINPSKQPFSCPTDQPSSPPTSQPSNEPSHPSAQPSRQPIMHPSGSPSRQPSIQPSRSPSHPSGQPSLRPSSQSSLQPSSQPTCQPSNYPTSPTSQPSVNPSQPSSQPSNQPSQIPSGNPSNQPLSGPSSYPSVIPSFQPSKQPTYQPSRQPSRMPNLPSSHPTMSPSSTPTLLKAKAASSINDKPSNALMILTASVWGLCIVVIILALLSFSNKWQEKKLSEIFKMDARTSLFHVHLGKSFKDYALATIPKVFINSNNTGRRLANEVASNHKYFSILASLLGYGIEGKFICALRIVFMLTMQTSILFLLVIFYELQCPLVATSSCRAFESIEDCLAGKTLFDSSTSLCAWNTYLVLGRNKRLCELNRDALSWNALATIFEIVMAIIAFLYIPFRKITHILTSPVIQENRSRTSSFASAPLLPTNVIQPGTEEMAVAVDDNRQHKVIINQVIEICQQNFHEKFHDAKDDVEENGDHQLPSKNKLGNLTTNAPTMQMADSAISIDEKDSFDKFLKRFHIQRTAINATSRKKFDEEWKFLVDTSILGRESTATPIEVEESFHSGSSDSANGKSFITVTPTVPQIGDALRKEIAIVEAEVSECKPILDSLIRKNEKQVGLEILHHFILDLLGRQSAAAKIFEKKFSDDFTKRHPVSWYTLFLTWSFVFVLDIGCFGYIIYRGILRSSDWQWRLFLGFVSQNFFEILVVETLICIWVHFSTPNLACDDFKVVLEELEHLVANLATSENVYGNVILNLPEFFFVSTNLAKLYPTIPESNFVMRYRNYFPNVVLRRFMPTKKHSMEVGFRSLWITLKFIEYLRIFVSTNVDFQELLIRIIFTGLILSILSFQVAFNDAGYSFCIGIVVIFVLSIFYRASIVVTTKKFKDSVKKQQLQVTRHKCYLANKSKRIGSLRNTKVFPLKPQQASSLSFHNVLPVLEEDEHLNPGDENLIKVIPENDMSSFMSEHMNDDREMNEDNSIIRDTPSHFQFQMIASERSSSLENNIFNISDGSFAGVEYLSNKNLGEILNDGVSAEDRMTPVEVTAAAAPEVLIPYSPKLFSVSLQLENFNSSTNLRLSSDSELVDIDSSIDQPGSIDISRSRRSSYDFNMGASRSRLSSYDIHISEDDEFEIMMEQREGEVVGKFPIENFSSGTGSGEFNISENLKLSENSSDSELLMPNKLEQNSKDSENRLSLADSNSDIFKIGSNEDNVEIFPSEGGVNIDSSEGDSIHGDVAQGDAPNLSPDHSSYDSESGHSTSGDDYD